MPHHLLLKMVFWGTSLSKAAQQHRHSIENPGSSDPNFKVFQLQLTPNSSDVRDTEALCPRSVHNFGSPNLTNNSLLLTRSLTRIYSHILCVTHVMYVKTRWEPREITELWHAVYWIGELPTPRWPASGETCTTVFTVRATGGGYEIITMGWCVPQLILCSYDLSCVFAFLYIYFNCEWHHIWSVLICINFNVL